MELQNMNDGSLNDNRDQNRLIGNDGMDHLKQSTSIQIEVTNSTELTTQVDSERRRSSAISCIRSELSSGGQLDKIEEDVTQMNNAVSVIGDTKLSLLWSQFTLAKTNECF